MTFCGRLFFFIDYHENMLNVLRFPHDLDTVIDENGGVYAIAHLTMHENHNWKSNHRNITHYESEKAADVGVFSFLAAVGIGAARNHGEAQKGKYKDRSRGSRNTTQRG
jgi:hypothetical protein